MAHEASQPANETCPHWRKGSLPYLIHSLFQKAAPQMFDEEIRERKKPKEKK
jgi:hypothetical protein